MEETDEQPAAASGEAVGRREALEEDDLDIYRDMEQSDSLGGVGFLPPPPEPPRMLVDFGNDDDSCCEDDDDDPVCRRPGGDHSGSGGPEIVNSPILESEIYDPAEPCMDSDDEIPVKPVQKVLEDDIPLPPGSPVGRSEESRTNVVSYSSTDSSSGCESGSEVKSKRGGGTLSSGLVPEVPDAEGSRGRLDHGSPDRREEEEEEGEEETAAAAAQVVGEPLVRCPDSRLSGGTSDGEQLQETDEKRVTDKFRVTDSLERLAKVCKVCSRASEGDPGSLDVCKCGSDTAGKRVDASSSSSPGSSSCSSSSSSNSDSSSSDSSDDVERSDGPVNRKSGRDAGRRKKGKRKNQNMKIQDENVAGFQFSSKRDKFLTGTVKGGQAGERCKKNPEADAVVGFSKASVRSTAENSLPDPAAQLGLEGLDTESISENEAFNFDDYCSRSENDGELGELDSVPPRKKRKLRNKLAGGRQSTSKLDIFKELSGNISLPKLDWNSEDDVVKKVCDVREDRVIERKGKKYEKENVTNDGVEIGKKSIFDKKSKKVNQGEIVGNVECKDNAIPWKKISLEGKERNYRDSKMSRSGEKEYHGVKGMSNKKLKKQKEKRKDIERYDVRKVLNDKRKIGDRFGRDQSREYSFSRSRSRSDHSRSRSKDRYRSRSRSYKSRRRSKNKTGRKSKDSFPREKRRASKRSERSRSRNNRSRSRSWSRSRKRQERERGRNGAKRTRSKRSWSRTWTPSWSRSRSGSTSSSSSFSRSCSPPPRKFNRSFSHSFSRSWSREPHEHIPVPKPSLAVVKPSKKHGGVVVLAKPKDEEHHVKKGKKKKDLRAEKNKKRKERLIPPSKEVFTSGDNILVSVNFNKSSRSSGLKTGGGDSSILGSSCLTLPSKITSKHSHLDENFEITKELGKKPKKEAISGDKMSEEGANADGTAGDAAASKPRRKVKKSLKEDKRFAAILKQKPIAVIDLDHSPFKERTPSPTDLIVLSDSNEEGVVNDASKVVDPELKKLCLDIPSPPEKSEMVLGRVPEIAVTTGPKTPPEPPNEGNLPLAKNKEAVTTFPSRDETFQLSEKELGGTDERDEQDATCPAPQVNAVVADLSVSSPGAYDPFDPTKSATPSPGGQESSADTAVMNTLSDSHDNPEEGNSHPPTGGNAPAVPDEAGAAEVRPCETSAECASVTNSDQGSAKDSPEVLSEVVVTELKVDVNVDVNNTVVNMEIDETDGPTRQGDADGNQDAVQAPPHQTVTTTVTQISAECSVTSVRCNEVPGKPADFLSNDSKLHLPLVSTTPVKHFQHPPHVTPPRNLAFLQLPLSTPLIHPPMLVQPKLPPPPLLSTPVVSRQPDFNQGLFLTSTPLAASKDAVAAPPDMSNISAIASYLVSSLAVTPQISAAPPPLLNVSEHLGLASIPTPPAHNGDRRQQKTQDTTEVVDMDLDSPYSPASSEGDDLFEPPPEMVRPAATFPTPKPSQQSHKGSKPNRHAESNVSKPPPPAKADPLHTLFSTIAKSAAAAKPNLHNTPSSKGNAALNKSRHSRSTRKEIHIKRAADQLEILDELPSSAVELQVKEKFLKKLNRQERVVDEVKIALKPHYTKKYITKDEYKDILRRAVPKICHNEPGEINPAKVSSLVEAYVKKYRYAKKKFGSHHHGAAAADKSSKNVM